MELIHSIGGLIFSVGVGVLAFVILCVAALWIGAFLIDGFEKYGDTLWPIFRPLVGVTLIFLTPVILVLRSGGRVWRAVGDLGFRFFEWSIRVTN